LGAYSDSSKQQVVEVEKEPDDVLKKRICQKERLVYPLGVVVRLTVVVWGLVELGGMKTSVFLVRTSCWSSTSRAERSWYMR
jgi:hypothetical protein